MKIAIVVFDGFTDLDVFLPWDVLNRVRLVGGINDWEVRIVGTSDTHLSMAGMQIPVTDKIDNLNNYEAVIFSSGIGVQNLYQNEDYLKRIQIDPAAQLIGSMCSGALILAALGVLKGEATTYPTAVEKLQRFGIKVVNESIVINGQVATAAGCLAAEQLSNWVIEKLAGKQMVQLISESIKPLGEAGKLPAQSTLKF
jgi:transcriptional regulator GlxA family with amidase domain